MMRCFLKDIQVAVGAATRERLNNESSSRELNSMGKQKLSQSNETNTQQNSRAVTTQSQSSSASK